jgi:threonine synthase
VTTRAAQADRAAQPAAPPNGGTADAVTDYDWNPWAPRRGLRCIACQRMFPLRDVIYRCPECGDLLDVVYPRPTFDPERIKGRWWRRRLSRKPVDASGVWRYRELMPFYDRLDQLVTYPEGNTPLLEAPRSAAYAGLRRLRF